MRTIPSGLATHIATRDLTMAYGLKITRKDTTVFGFTSHDHDDTISSVLYKADPGLNVTSIVIAAGASVGNLELTTVHDGSVFTAADLLSRIWDNADFILFQYNWANIANGIDIKLTGNFGIFQLKREQVVAELRDLRQYFQQDIGDASSKNCRARLGDSRCKKVLTSFTYTGTLTSATSNQVFRDSSRAEGITWFDEGEITFTGGANSGLTSKVKSFAADGTFTLALPMINLVAAGDTYSAIAGCRKRLEDCRDKFNNILNMVAEPHRKGVNNLTQSAIPSV